MNDVKFVMIFFKYVDDKILSFEITKQDEKSGTVITNTKQSDLSLRIFESSRERERERERERPLWL